LSAADWTDTERRGVMGLEHEYRDPTISDAFREQVKAQILDLFENHFPSGATLDMVTRKALELRLFSTALLNETHVRGLISSLRDLQPARHAAIVRVATEISPCTAQELWDILLQRHLFEPDMLRLLTEH
jgi:hypothetical protein